MAVAKAETLGLSAAALLGLACCNSVFLGHYVDDVVWLLLSRSFLEGSLLSAWSFFPRLETSATWGFSLLLAPAVALFGANAVALKAWSAGLFLAGTFLFYVATRGGFSPRERLAYLAALFFNGFYLSFAGSVISEAGYLLLFGAGAYLIARREWLARPTGERLALLGLLSAFLILTRVIGTAFFLAAVLELCLARRFREAARYAAVVAAAVLPYFLLCKLASGAFTYHASGWAVLSQASVPAAVKIPLANAYFYLKGLSLLTFIYFPAFMPNAAWLKIPVAAAVVGVAAFGAARAAALPGGRFLLAYSLLYGMVCAAWPFQGPRFIVPVYPLFAFLFLSGLVSLVPRRFEARALAALGVLVLATNLGEIGGLLRASLTQGPDIPHIAHAWLRDHSTEGDLIVSMDIARIRYYAGRRGIHFLPSDSLESFVRRARELGARYFFLKEVGYVGTTLGGADSVAAQYARLAEYLGHAEHFALVYENRKEGVRVFVLRPDSTGAGLPGALPGRAGSPRLGARS